MLIEAGYSVKIFNTIEMAYSNNYNPFHYVYNYEGQLSEDSVMKMIDTFMKNTRGEGEKDDFWSQSAMKAIIETLKCDIWSLYYPNDVNMETDDVKFKLLVSKAYRELNISTYSNTYVTVSRKLLNALNGISNTINSKMAAYLKNDVETIGGSIVSTTQKQLDAIWCENATTEGDMFKNQSPNIKEDMRLIEEKIVEVSAINSSGQQN